MSLSTDKRAIQCDGKNCSQRIEVPIALSRRLSGAPLRPEGWLYVGMSQHYCPACADKFLRTLLVRSANCMESANCDTCPERETLSCPVPMFPHGQA